MRSTTLLLVLMILSNLNDLLAQEINSSSSLRWKEENCKASFQGEGIHLSNTSGGTGFLWLSSTGFRRGTIELDIKGKDVRGESFVGLAFHAKDQEEYDAVYFRPFNFRDKERKDRAVQYVSKPEFDWDLLREKHPGKYEHSIVPDTDPNDWFHVRLVVTSQRIRVFVNNSSEPTLDIEQLSKRSHERLALWLDSQEGWFRNVKISNDAGK